MAKSIGRRPPVAIGHVLLPVKNVPATSGFLRGLGLRQLVEGDTFAVLELRGGTHLVLEKSRRRTKPGTQAPVDFMVDGPFGGTSVNKSQAFLSRRAMRAS